MTEHGQDPFRPDQVGGPLLECDPVHLAEIRPPICGIRIEHLHVEDQHELRFGDLVLGQSVCSNGTVPAASVMAPFWSVTYRVIPYSN
jgi:hypothetical protein